jgi:hypothetical protein
MHQRPPRSVQCLLGHEFFFCCCHGGACPAMTPGPERCYHGLAFRKLAPLGTACNDFLSYDFLLAPPCWPSCSVRCRRPLNRLLLPSGQLSQDRL